MSHLMEVIPNKLFILLTPYACKYFNTESLYTFSMEISAGIDLMFIYSFKLIPD